MAIMRKVRLCDATQELCDMLRVRTEGNLADLDPVVAQLRVRLEKDAVLLL